VTAHRASDQKEHQRRRIEVVMFTPATYPLELTLNNTPTQVYFSPNSGCTESIVQEITDAKGEILVQAFLANSEIPTFIDDRHAIAHNKIMIIDQSTVITGSFNFTRAAQEKDAENFIIIKSKELARIYMDNWNRHRQHPESYAPRY
jgi:phosphatidylserine/phosphatidylglycerophosphate/cardiolipin synthase-like enzyme